MGEASFNLACARLTLRITNTITRSVDCGNSGVDESGARCVAPNGHAPRETVTGFESSLSSALDSLGWRRDNVVKGVCAEVDKSMQARPVIAQARLLPRAAGSHVSFSQSIELVGGESVENAAEKETDERHDQALNLGFRELEKSRRYEAGDEGGYAQIAEERCSEFEPFVVHQVGDSQISSLHATLTPDSTPCHPNASSRSDTGVAELPIRAPAAKPRPDSDQSGQTRA